MVSSGAANAAAASGEEDEVLGEDGGEAVAPAAPRADRLPGADDATLEVLDVRHAGEQNEYPANLRNVRERLTEGTPGGRG